MTPEELRTLTLFNTVESRPEDKSAPAGSGVGCLFGADEYLFSKSSQKRLDSSPASQTTALALFSHSKGSTGKKSTQPLLPAPHT